jgi:imidazolonepropionase-like amidohydrolase
MSSLEGACNSVMGHDITITSQVHHERGKLTHAGTGNTNRGRNYCGDILTLQDILKLATFSDFYGELDNGAIFVRGNVIEWVGRTEALPEQYATADEIISLPDRVVIPGLVNTHHHMCGPSYLTTQSKFHVGADGAKEIFDSFSG